MIAYLIDTKGFRVNSYSRNNYFVLAKDFEYGQSCVLVHNADNLLYRFGTSKESATRLQRKASEAANNPEINIHGVSASGNQPIADFSTADRPQVETVFPVHNTPRDRDPLHVTIELPNPVTPAAAKLFNNFFGR